MAAPTTPPPDAETLTAALARAAGFVAPLTPAQAQALAALVDLALPGLARTVRTPDAGHSGFAATLASDPGPVVRDELVTPLPEEMPGRYDLALGEGGGVLELGRGGIGRVLAARDTTTGRVVALKQLWHERLAAVDTRTSADLDARFLREARITAQLEHPAIVPVYEIGRRADQALYYTMRRIQGRTLSAAAAEAKALPDKLRLVPAIITVCRAVAYAHSRGVLHRDIKPQNVMLGAFGEAWLLDWGLSHRSQEGAETDAVDAPNLTAGVNLGAIGTPAYLSPEQSLGGRDIDERSDVFGLGSLLYELLTGRPPWLGTTAVQALAAARTGRVPRVAGVAPETPAELAAICDQAVAREAGDRYQSAAALADDLEAWLQGRAVHAYDYGPLELVRRFARRHRAAVSVGLVAAVALAAVLVAAGVRVRAEQAAAESFGRLLFVDVSQQLLPQPTSVPLLAELTRRGSAFYLAGTRIDDLTLEGREQLAKAWIGLAQKQIELGQPAAGLSALELARRLAPLDSPLARSSKMLRSVSVQTLVVGAELAHFTGDDEGYHRQLVDADALVEQGPEGWDAWQWHNARQAVGSLLGRWEDEHGTTDASLAKYRSAWESSKWLAEKAPHDRDKTIIMLQALMDLAVRTANKSQEDAIALGQQAVDRARAMPNRWSDAEMALAVGSTMRQQALVLRAASRPDDATALEREGRPYLEHSLELNPSSLGGLTEYGDLLMQMGAFADAVKVLKKVGEMAPKSDFQTSLLRAELFSGQADAVVAGAAQIEAHDNYEQQLLLSLALARTGKPAEASRVLRKLGERAAGPLGWYQGAVPALGAAQGGPIGAAVARFGRTADAAVLTSSDDFQAAVTALAEELAKLPAR